MRLLQHPVMSTALASCCALLLAASTTTAAAAATPATKPAAKAVKSTQAIRSSKAVGKTALRTAPATPRQQANNAAKGLALATETTEAINAAQLDIAARVLTGAADCEFNQKVTVQPVDGQAGHFSVTHQGRHYRMVPRETSTGAVRLEDPINGIVWLQIPVKSMLMNARRGQRMVDSCMHAEQRAAVAAATAAGQAIGQGIGIVPEVASAPLRPALPATTGTMGAATALATATTTTTAADTATAMQAGTDTAAPAAVPTAVPAQAAASR